MEGETYFDYSVILHSLSLLYAVYRFLKHMRKMCNIECTLLRILKTGSNILDILENDLIISTIGTTDILLMMLFGPYLYVFYRIFRRCWKIYDAPCYSLEHVLMISFDVVDLAEIAQHIPNYIIEGICCIILIGLVKAFKMIFCRKSCHNQNSTEYEDSFC